MLTGATRLTKLIDEQQCSQPTAKAIQYLSRAGKVPTGRAGFRNPRLDALMCKPTRVLCKLWIPPVSKRHTPL